MVTRLIHDIPTCRELIDCIMTEADDIIRKKLLRLVLAKLR